MWPGSGCLSYTGEKNMTLEKQIAAIPYWYHKIELPGGIITPGWSPIDPARYCIPEDLTGKRVLDIGAWDGYWTWESLKRGAKEVVAIDDFSDNLGILRDGDRRAWDSFDICREAFGFTEQSTGQWLNEKGQTVERFEMSVYDLSREGDDDFDVVFFFGTIYHLKHPLLALEKISEVCVGSLYIETASLDEASPYQGGIGHGFDRNEMVMEFYPTKEYAQNESNWWAPTLQCLGAMMHTVGFRDIQCWPLVEKPKEMVECRGFASGTKDAENNPANHPDDLGETIVSSPQKIAAVMSVPRLGFTDNLQCTTAALMPMRIPLINVQGAFWGQCLERGIQKCIDSGYDIIVTIDYDTAFKREDLEAILKIMVENPDVSAVLPIQIGRGNRLPLATLKTRTGVVRNEVPLEEFKADTIQIATGHFALTALRVKDLMDVPHPWFHDQPNTDGQWGPGRVDADIYFWQELEKAGKKVLMANRVVVGHMELLCTWPDSTLRPIYQMPGDFHDNGKPKNCWQ
jgi:tRNA (mo5U34)-methyltransferase